MNKEYVIEVKVRDGRTNQVVDEGKIFNRKGWDWLNSKYGIFSYGSALLDLQFSDLDSIWDKNPEELIEYVERRRKEFNK